MFGEGPRNLWSLPVGLCSFRVPRNHPRRGAGGGQGSCDNADSDSERDIDTALPRTALQLPSMCADSPLLSAQAWAPGCQLL